MATHTISPYFFIERAMLVLSRPRECWHTLSQDRIEPARLFIALALPLAILSALSHRLASAIVGSTTAQSAVAEHFTSLASEIVALSALPFLIAWMVVRLCSFFASCAEFDQAYSLVVHALIPCSLAQAIPLSTEMAPLYFLAAASYSLYLLYSGMALMLHVPHAQRIPLFVTIFVLLFLLVTVTVSVVALASSVTSAMPTSSLLTR